MNFRRVAVIGSGPAGLYAVEQLLQRPGLEIEVDVYEKWPVPWGLLRHGVAPDHGERKRIADRVFAGVMRHPRVHWFGQVEFGRHFGPNDLAAWYDAVVYATGAEVPMGLDIPGASLPGSTTAREVVAWYNGHPDADGFRLDAQAERAVIVGQGNVALDVARLLLMPPELLARTDMAPRAIEWLRCSRLREVVLVGRRGLADAAFTASAIESLQTVPALQVVLTGDPGSRDAAAMQRRDAPTRRKLAVLHPLADRPPVSGARRLVFESFVAPQSLVGRQHVQALCGLRDGHALTWQAGIVISAIGQRSAPLPGLPFDAKRGIVPNERGRVCADAGAGGAPAYVVGWLKRGCQGNLGLNRLCAAETVQALFEDLAVAAAVPRPKRAVVAQRLAERQPDLLQWTDWQRIDRAEREAGRRVGAPRVKLTDRSAQLAIVRSASIPMS